MRLIVKHSFTLFILLMTSGSVASVASVAAQQTVARRTSVAVVSASGIGVGQRAADKLTTALAADADLAIEDADASRAAAKGAGYSGLLNLTLAEARDLGLALGSDFYLLSDAQVQRRSPSSRAPYFEAYASLFLVSTRTGRLAMWERPSFEAATPEAAEKLLLASLAQSAARYREAIHAAEARERDERAQALEHRAPLVENVPEEGSAAAEGLRLPAPYRRLQPAYPDAAASVGAEGIVDVEVEIDASGEVGRTDVVRWAGYGLDESAVNTVRQLHFRPAMRDGVAVPLRVLLRYNFRRPPKEETGQKSKDKS